MAATKTSGEAASLLRGLKMLELMAQRPHGATLREITDELALPGASVLRLARTLVDAGYLSRDVATKRFFLTNSFLRLGQPRTASRSLSECSLAAMRQIRQLTGETTQLCCLVDTEMVILEQLLSLHPFKYSADLGARCPCYSCAPGKAIAAFLPADETEALIERLSLKRFTANTITTKRGLRRELEQIRTQGYALDRAEGMDGIHCIAAPILDRNGFAVGAITIAGPASRLPEDEFETTGQLIREAVSRASEEFNQS